MSNRITEKVGGRSLFQYLLFIYSAHGTKYKTANRNKFAKPFREWITKKKICKIFLNVGVDDLWVNGATIRKLPIFFG